MNSVDSKDDGPPYHKDPIARPGSPRPSIKLDNERNQQCVVDVTEDLDTNIKDHTICWKRSAAFPFPCCHHNTHPDAIRTCLITMLYDDERALQFIEYINGDGEMYKEEPYDEDDDWSYTDDINCAP